MFGIGKISGRGVYRGVDLEANFFNFACTQSAGNQLVHPGSLLIALAVCVCVYVRVGECVHVCTVYRIFICENIRSGVSDKSYNFLLLHLPLVLLIAKSMEFCQS